MQTDRIRAALTLAAAVAVLALAGCLEPGGLGWDSQEEALSSGVQADGSSWRVSFRRDVRGDEEFRVVTLVVDRADGKGRLALAASQRTGDPLTEGERLSLMVGRAQSFTESWWDSPRVFLDGRELALHALKTSCDNSASERRFMAVGRLAGGDLGRVKSAGEARVELVHTDHSDRDEAHIFGAPAYAAFTAALRRRLP